MAMLMPELIVQERHIEYISHDSYKFHIREGFSKVAHIKSVGKKFERWYDLLWFQKKVER